MGLLSRLKKLKRKNFDEDQLWFHVPADAKYIHVADVQDRYFVDITFQNRTYNFFAWQIDQNIEITEENIDMLNFGYYCSDFLNNSEAGE